MALLGLRKVVAKARLMKSLWWFFIVQSPWGTGEKAIFVKNKTRKKGHKFNQKNENSSFSKTTRRRKEDQKKEFQKIQKIRKYIIDKDGVHERTFC